MGHFTGKKIISLAMALAIITGISLNSACYAMQQNPFSTTDPIAPSYINQPFTPMNKRDPRIQTTHPQNPYFNHNSANPFFSRG
jgi:hypothetical protein